MHTNESHSSDNTYNPLKEKRTTKKDMKLKNVHLYLISAVINSIFIHSSYSATYYTTPGKFVDLPQQNAQSIYPSDTQYTGFNDSICRLLVVTDYENGYASFDVPSIVNIGDYQGMKGSDNLIYIIYSTTITSNVEYRDYKITFDMLGSSSINLPAIKRNNYCWDYIDQYDNKVGLRYGVLSGLSTGRKIFVPDNTAPGTYPLQDMYFSRYAGIYFKTKYKIFDSNDVIVVMPSFSCTINTPPEIAFGSFDIGVNDASLLGYKQQDLLINCSGGDKLAHKMSIQFSGVYQSGLSGRLVLKNKSGEKMAFIRGRYLSDTGTCNADAVNEVLFNKQNPKIIQVHAGATTVPITWSLCKDSSGVYGEGKAEATVAIDWD